jgi:hypothetical protein
MVWPVVNPPAFARQEYTRHPGNLVRLANAAQRRAFGSQPPVCVRILPQRTCAKSVLDQPRRDAVHPHALWARIHRPGCAPICMSAALEIAIGADHRRALEAAHRRRRPSPSRRRVRQHLVGATIWISQWFDRTLLSSDLAELVVADPARRAIIGVGRRVADQMRSPCQTPCAFRRPGCCRRLLGRDAGGHWPSAVPAPCFALSVCRHRLARVDACGWR